MLSQLDVHGLLLFEAVVRHRSFTRAGREFGLTQSAVTRHVQQLEEVVGVRLLRRTTRSVRLTEPGQFFLEASRRFTREFGASLERFGELYLGRPPRVSVGLSHGIAHSHLPGLIAHFRRSRPDVQVSVVQEPGPALRERLLDHRLDLAVFTRPPREPEKLRLLHSFRDDFVVVEPPRRAPAAGSAWLVFDPGSTTGNLVSQWVAAAGSRGGDGTATATAAGSPPVPAVELTSFDLIISLVALGIGRSVVPRRALRLYGRRLPVVVVEPDEPLYRHVGVYCRASGSLGETAEAFVESILFDWKVQGKC